jgi:hypothetical protein
MNGASTDTPASINDTPEEEQDAGPRSIPRPDVTVAHIVLLILAQRGPRTFAEIRKDPLGGQLAGHRSENSFYTALARLKRRRQIIRKSDHTYELTSAGEYAALKAYVRKETVQIERGDKHKARSWDGRWRVIVFDVPESKRAIRDYFRSLLKRLGFAEFQRSMWLSPHKTPSFLLKILEDPVYRKYARHMTVSDIDYDDDLRRKFKLQ